MKTIIKIYKTSGFIFLFIAALTSCTSDLDIIPNDDQTILSDVLFEDEAVYYYEQASENPIGFRILIEETKQNISVGNISAEDKELGLNTCDTILRVYGGLTD